MIVTLFSDASWCPDSGAGGWGAWVKSSRVKRGAVFQGPIFRCTSSGEAEIVGASLALLRAVEAGVAAERDIILFQLDSTEALLLIPSTGAHRRGAPGASGGKRAAVEALMYLSRRYRFQYRSRHVKGHSRHDGSRQSVNILCDRLAREQMERARCLISDTRDRADTSPATAR